VVKDTAVFAVKRSYHTGFVDTQLHSLVTVDYTVPHKFTFTLHYLISTG